jgi:tetratricopeptide (TPR) repeat protein
MAETNETIANHYAKTLEQEMDEDKSADEESRADETAPDGADETSAAGQADAARRRARRELMEKKAKHENRLRSSAADYFLVAANIHASSSAPKGAAMMLKAGEILSQSKTLELKERAAAVFSEAADKFKAAGDKEAQTQALISAGDVFREADNKELWSRADSYYELAVRVYRDAGLKKDEAETFSSIAFSYVSSNDPGQKRKAVDYYQRAATIYVETKDQPAEVSALLSAASVLVNLEDKEAQLQGTALYDRAVAMYENNFPKQIATLIRIGSSLLRVTNETRIVKAETYFQQAVALAEKKGGKKGAASAYLDIGMAYQSLRQFSKATASFDRARSLYQELNDSYGQGMALYRLASLYTTSTARKAEAIQLADQSLALLAQALPGLESSGDKKGLADGHYAMGYLYRWIKKDNAKSLVSYTSAYKLYKTMPDQRGRLLNMERSIPGLRKAVNSKP